MDLTRQEGESKFQHVCRLNSIITAVVRELRNTGHGTHNCIYVGPEPWRERSIKNTVQMGAFRQCCGEDSFTKAGTYCTYTVGPFPRR